MITQATLLGSLSAPVAIGAQFYSARPGQSHIFAFEVLLGDLAAATAIARRMEAEGNLSPDKSDLAEVHAAQSETSAVATKRRPKSKATADATEESAE